MFHYYCPGMWYWVCLLCSGISGFHGTITYGQAISKLTIAAGLREFLLAAVDTPGNRKETVLTLAKLFFQNRWNSNVTVHSWILTMYLCPSWLWSDSYYSNTESALEGVALPLPLSSAWSTPKLTHKMCFLFRFSQNQPYEVLSCFLSNGVTILYLPCILCHH